MKNTDTMTPQELADAIATLPNVEMTRHMPGRIMVQYPRERGGRIVFSIQSARKHFAADLSR